MTADFDPIDQGTFDKILQYGHQVTYVGGEGDDPPFAYTVGRSMKDRPELLITGPLPPSIMQRLLNEAVAIDERRPLAPDQDLDDLLFGYTARVIEADPEAAEMNLCFRFFSNVTALQILWPDKRGRFPGAPGFTLPQPVYPK